MWKRSVFLCVGRVEERREEKKRSDEKNEMRTTIHFVIYISVVNAKTYLIMEQKKKEKKIAMKL